MGLMQFHQMMSKFPQVEVKKRLIFGLIEREMFLPFVREGGTRFQEQRHNFVFGNHDQTTRSITSAFSCGARSAFKLKGIRLLEKRAIAPLAASLCWLSGADIDAN